MSLVSASTLSDEHLLERLRDSVSDERLAIVSLLLLLGELERRRGYPAHGCDSLFTFCRRVLGLCEGASVRRIEGVRLLARYPQVEAMLRDARLCLTPLCALKPVLTDDNSESVFARAAGRSKAGVLELVAELSPRPAMRNFIAPVSSPSVSGEQLPAPQAEDVPRTESATMADAASLPPPIPSRPVDRMAPLSPALHRLNVTVSKEFLDDLNEAKLALSHKFPKGGLEEILREGLRLIVKQANGRRALTERPRKRKTETPVPDKLQVNRRNRERPDGKVIAPDEDEKVAKRPAATAAKPKPPVMK